MIPLLAGLRQLRAGLSRRRNRLAFRPACGIFDQWFMPISGAKRIRLCEVGVSGMPRLSGGLVKHLANT